MVERQWEDLPRKAGTSSTGDNLIASVYGYVTYDHFDWYIQQRYAVTTIGASGPLGSAGTLSAVMSSTGSSKITALSSSNERAYN